jgi:hypothetical protein
MKSITIHGLDDPLIELIKTKAKNDRTSLNKTVKALLEQSLGITSYDSQPHRKDFEEFCGIWSDEEKDQFDQAVADFNQIDKDEWK